MSEDARTAAVKAALDRYVDPYVGDTLGAAQAVQAVEPRGAGHMARITLGFPVGGPGGGYAPELEAALRAHLHAAGIDTPLMLSLAAEIRAHSVQKQLKPLGGIKNLVCRLLLEK